MPRNRGKARARKKSRAPLARLDANATASAAEAPPDMSPDGDVVLDDVHVHEDGDQAAADEPPDQYDWDGDAAMLTTGTTGGWRASPDRKLCPIYVDIASGYLKEVEQGEWGSARCDGAQERLVTWGARAYVRPCSHQPRCPPPAAFLRATGRAEPAVVVDT